MTISGFRAQISPNNTQIGLVDLAGFLTPPRTLRQPVALAQIYYQLNVIHPFPDGNPQPVYRAVPVRFG